MREPTAPRTKSGERRRDQILQVATSLFRQRGYGITSLDDIADQIGFTKPAIYHYFKSKEDILYAIVGTILEDSLARATAIVNGPGTASERMHALVTDHTRTTLSNLDANVVFYSERGRMSPEREQLMRDRERDYDRVVQDLYAEGVASGEFVDLNPALATRTILGASIWSHRWFDADGALTVDEVAEQIATLLLGGCRNAAGVR